MPPPRDWTVDLHSLVACNVLPAVPPADALQKATSLALQEPDSATPATSAAGQSSGAAPLFAAQQLYDAVMRCVQAEPGIPEQARTSAALLIASVAMEEYVRSHSTKAKLASEQHARRARAAAAAGAAGSANNGVDASTSPALAGPGPGGSGSGSSGGGGAEDAELLSFLRSASPQRVATRLLEVLGEPEQSRTPLTNIVRKHDPDSLAAILRQTRLAHAEGDTERADGLGKRTLGGIFFREAKRFKAGATRVDTQAALPELPPLRPYQADVVGMVLASWGLEPPPELLAAAAAGNGGGGAAAAKREAQRFLDLARGWRRNWLISAPTNSGKTRMFIEVSRGLIESKPPGRGALVVVLVPQAILSTQHALYFERANLPRTIVTAYSSDNSLTLPAWRAAVAATGRGRGGGGGGSNVLVCTAQSVLNMLRQGARLEDVDLLVLDEAHHCKDDDPYAQIVNNHYAADAPHAPRLLGVTASPASEKNPVTLSLRMSSLLGRLGAALHVLPEDDPGVAAALPEPKQIEARVEGRQVDQQLMLALQSFALNSAMELAESLAQAEARGSEAEADKTWLQQELDAAINASLAPVTAATPQYLVTALDRLGQWLSRGVEFASRYHCPHLELACRLLDVLRKSVELVEDAGFEGALPFLARKAAALCRQEADAERKAGRGGPGAPPAAATPAPTAFRGLMFSAALQAAAAAGAAVAAGAAPAPAPELPEPPLLAALRSASADLPSAQGLAAGAAAERAPSRPGNKCSDVGLRVSSLLRELMVGCGEVRFLAAPESARLVRGCFASGQLQEECTFPKYWALLQYLQRYRQREIFHGIVFVKTRQAVFHVADMMRRTQQLDFMEVFELIGHNSAAGKRSTLAPEADRHGRGMSDAQQQQVLRMFKTPGRKVLVATSAAEEGLDVPSCEFVVRYNAAATGIQLLQSRGRARRKVAEFFAILQDGTLDTALHTKSRLEEANMRAYGRMHAEAAAGRGTGGV